MIRNIMDVEPVLLMNLIAAVIAVLIAFRVPVTPDQQKAILALVAAIIAVYAATAAVARSRVYAPRTVRRMLAEANGDA